MAGVRTDPDILERVSWDYVPKDALRLNVLMFGFDSMSRMMFMRKFPKSYEKLKSLGSIVLEGYNILGDGTPQAIIPLMTGWYILRELLYLFTSKWSPKPNIYIVILGKTELELPETRKRMGSKANFVNIYPFIWNDYRKFGYATG